MDLIHAAILALIQGITEFLPISSSGHLILPAELLGWPDQGLAFDTAVHLGSLAAVVTYFRKELLTMTAACLRYLQTKESTADARLAGNLILASLPIIPVGFFSRYFVEAELRNIGVIAMTSIVFALLLWYADHRRTERHAVLSPGRALLIGLAQCLALIPGTSRSGVTMTTALLVGYSREYAARISLMISIPAIAGAATLKLIDITRLDTEPDWAALAVGTSLAALSAYACIAMLIRFVARVGFLPFVIYRLLLGVFLILLIQTQ